VAGYKKIEFLVVIALFLTIAIFATVGFLDLQKGLRDSKRKADIGIIASSLEAHYNNKANQFCPNVQVNSYCHPQFTWFQGGIPTDPLRGDYIHLPASGDKQYLICAKLEIETGNSASTDGTPARSNKGQYYCQKNQQ
jgi:hypothetical protein